MPFPQEKRLIVLPRVCKTDFTQIPIAADSLSIGFCFDLSFTVGRTDLIHRQSREWSSFLDRVLAFFDAIRFNLQRRKEKNKI